MRMVVALGGNALLERGESPDAEVQEHHVHAAIASLTPLVQEHQVVVTHGNGPQVGLLALESARDPSLTRPYPFDVLGAQTQGMIGYWLLQALQNVLPGREVASIISQTLVSAADPAFANPTKFIGPVYSKEEAETLAANAGWTIRQDGAYWRRVIASPRPHRVVETRLIRQMMDLGVVVVCAGGGGVPVIHGQSGQLRGVEAVIDKDATAGLLAEALDSEFLLLLTDIPYVCTDFGTPREQPIYRATPAYLRSLEFPAGSMGPKIDAVCRFVEMTGHVAAIGALTDAPDIITGKAGTIISPSGVYG